MGGVLPKCVIVSCRQTQPRPILDHQGRPPVGRVGTPRIGSRPLYRGVLQGISRGMVQPLGAAAGGPGIHTVLRYTVGYLCRAELLTLPEV